MAMVKCKECGKEISTSATECPHCGKKITKPLVVIFEVIAIVLLLAVLWVALSMSGVL